MQSSYYKERPEVADLIPKGSRYILDIGCGDGSLGALIKRLRPQAQVRGVEPLPQPAERAAAVLDGVHVGFGGQPLPPDWPTPDCLVFADSLEHMTDPWSVLKTMVAALDANATVVISLPNVLHHSVIFGLLRGRWDYKEQGPLDATHFRFFTRSNAVELLRGAGLDLEELQRVRSIPGPGLIKVLLGWLLEPLFLWEKWRGVPERGARLLDVFTIQYLLVGRVPQRPKIL